jgi:hypothetical protein
VRSEAWSGGSEGKGGREPPVDPGDGVGDGAGALDTTFEGGFVAIIAILRA